MMHKIALNPAVVALTLARRGRPHAFSDLDPRRTALLVVDLQNTYLDATLGQDFNQHALDIVPNVNRIARALRSAGGIVVWIQNTITEESLRSWSSYNYRILSPERREKRIVATTEGNPGHGIWPGLEVEEGDFKVKKSRYSAFIPGSSDIEPLLRRRGIDTLAVTGTGTGTCCESTARDAMMLNFATIMVSDANACDSDDVHNASLSAFYRNFGDVMTTDELIGYIEANRAANANAAE
jgi:ureidoacrylate peracid hydrolase